MKELPQLAPEDAAATAIEEGRSEAGGPPTPPERPVTSSVRLVATLAAAGALAGLVMVFVFGWANPKIQAHRAEVLREAIQEVLNGPEAVRTYYLVDGALSESAAPGAWPCQ